MSDSANETIRRLWALCGELRDDGLAYTDYLTELSPLLFLKLAEELGVEASLAKDARWSHLSEAQVESKLDTYAGMLSNLANSKDPLVGQIFMGVHTRIRNPRTLARIVEGINSVDWYRAKQSGLGDIYEGLIEKAFQESRSGAGQYFTPRPVLEAIVDVMQPGSEVIYDPAAGTGGFLVTAGIAAIDKGESPSLLGQELVRDVQQMALMNIFLHGLDAQLSVEDTLAMSEIPDVDLCLTNPPFGTRSSKDLETWGNFDFPTLNKQLAFLQHVSKSLTPNGRAAIVVPDNVLFEGGTAQRIRTHLLDNFNLHTVLRLPAGVFYATGVRTSVLFFSAGSPTRTTWFYDLRDLRGELSKRKPLARTHFSDFVKAFGKDKNGKSKRKSSDRFQSMRRADLAKRNDRLDLDVTAALTSPRPALVIAEDLSAHLAAATDATNELHELLSWPVGSAEPQ